MVVCRAAAWYLRILWALWQCPLQLQLQQHKPKPLQIYIWARQGMARPYEIVHTGTVSSQQGLCCHVQYHRRLISEVKLWNSAIEHRMILIERTVYGVSIKLSIKLNLRRWGRHLRPVQHWLWLCNLTNFSILYCHQSLTDVHIYILIYRQICLIKAMERICAKPHRYRYNHDIKF